VPGQVQPGAAGLNGTVPQQGLQQGAPQRIVLRLCLARQGHAAQPGGVHPGSSGVRS
jgi:hypothetical protein